MPVGYEIEKHHAEGAPLSSRNRNLYPGEYWGQAPGEEAVDLTALLKTLSKHAPAALTGTLTGAVIGLLIAAWMPKTYSSTSLAEFIPSPMAKILNPLEAGEGASQAPLRQTVEPFIIIAQSQGVMELVAQKLENRRMGSNKASFSVKLLPATNILAFEAESGDKKIVEPASNAWKESTIEFLENLNAENLRSGRSQLLNRYQVNRLDIQNLQTQIEKIKPDLEIKKAELKIKNDQLLAYSMELEGIKSSIAGAQIVLPALKEEIKKHEKNLSPAQFPNINKTPAPTYSVNGGGEAKTVYVFNSLYDELEKKISDNEVSLQTLQPKKNQLEILYKQTLEEIGQLQKFASDQTVRLGTLERDLSMKQKEFEIIYGKVGESNLASALSSANLRSLGPANPPSPISKTKKFIIFGCFLGLCGGFLIHRFLLNKSAVI